MARRRARTSVRRGSGPSRKLVWARAIFADFTVSDTPESADLLAPFEGALGADLIGCTITRSLLDFGWGISTPSVTDEIDRIAVGLLKGSDQVPALSPAVNGDQDWFYWAVKPFIGVRAATTVETRETYGWSVDLRSKRKLDELGETVQFHYAAGPADALYNVSLTASFLIALP